MEIVLNRRLARSHLKKLEFRDAEPQPAFETEPGLEAFLGDPKLSAGINEHEIAYLKSLSPDGKRPAPLFYYRELQNLRDPLNFLPLSPKKQRGQTFEEHGHKNTVKGRRRRST